MTASNFSSLCLKPVAMSACLILLFACQPITAEDDRIDDRMITVAAIQNLKFHLGIGKISFSDKGERYEIHPPSGTRESRIDIATKLLPELRRASHLSVQVHINDKGEAIVQPHSWVFHYNTTK